MWTSPFTLLEFFQKPRYWGSCLLVLIIFNFIWSRRKLYLLSWQLYGPIALPLLGNLQLAVKPSQAITKLVVILSKSPNKMVRYWLGTKLFIAVADPTVIAQVNRLVEKPDVYNYLGTYSMVDGLLQATSKSAWTRALKICRPAFGLENVKSFIPIFHTESLRTVDALMKMACSGESCLPTPQSIRYSFSSALRNFFDCQTMTEEECTHLENAFEMIFQHLHNRLLMPLYKNKILYWLVGLHQNEIETNNIVIHYMKKIMDQSKLGLEKEQSSSNSGDFLTRNSLLRGVASNVPDVKYEELRMQGAMLLNAAVDTTKTQNLVTLLMLALNSEVQEKVHKELIEVLGDDVNQIPSYEDLMKLHYLDRVLKECLRMYSAAPMVAKTLLKDMKVITSDGEYTLPAGSTVVNMIYSIHNDPDYYPNPAHFDPDRWLPDQISLRPSTCYLPFSNGARHCPGVKYGQLQMRMLVASVLRTFEILPGKRCRSMQDVQIEMRGTLHLGDNCQFRLRRRNQC